MLRTMRLVVGALVVLAGGVALAQPNADGLFPLKKGSKWVYKVSDQTVEVEVAGTEKVGSVDAVKLSTKVNNKEVATELVEVRADGVYRLAVKGEKIEPPVKFLAVPVKKGEKWKVDSKVSNQAVKGEFTVADDKAKVKVPAGEFEAVYVEGPEFEIAGLKTAIKYWFVKDKGVVKLSYNIQGGGQGTDAVLELKEYVEGK